MIASSRMRACACRRRTSASPDCRLGIRAQADDVAGTGQVQFQQLADGRVRVDYEDVCTHRNSWGVGFVSTTTGSNMHEAKSAEQYDFD
jgi:hypothetical protein